MRYNPRRVTRQERLCFQLIGDKSEAKVRTRQPLTPAERNDYWSRAIARELAKAARHA